MKIKFEVKRVYDEPGPADGQRILVDRLWPRGMSKEKAKVDLWARAIAPTAELRKWYGHDPGKWVEFQRRYRAELKENAAEVALLLKAIGSGPATLLYGSKERKRSNAEALKRFLTAAPKKQR